MRFMTMFYPGDPPIPVTEMTRAEFIHHHPRTPYRITDLVTGEYTEYPVPPDEVVCDSCNGDCGDTVVVLGEGLRGVCLKCAQEDWYPHCKECDPTRGEFGKGTRGLGR